jgi:transcription antitermination factor NusG
LSQLFKKQTLSTELQEVTESGILSGKPVKKPEMNWFVFYTCPRAEKLVNLELLKRDYEVFLPRRKMLKLWKNRQKKWVEEVIFPGYIFVYTQTHELFNITRIPKVVMYIHCYT